jgi:hypothetical protein
LVIKVVQPPLRGCANLFQRVLMMEEDDGRGGNEFISTGDYLNHWQRRIVDEVQDEIGRTRLSGVPSGRPHYVWGALNGVYLARTLGIKRISVAEFGVAGGNGLVALEVIADKLSRAFEVEIDVYGFDTGVGCPKPTDYRDSPNLFREADYPMDVESLRKRLKRAQLVLGPVETSVPTFIASHPSPLAFAAFDMAAYSATSKAMRVFEASEEMLLPRVQCYFVGTTGLTFSDFTADRLAISEFNATHAMRKVTPCYSLESFVYDSKVWAGRMFLAHIFDHALYGTNDGLIKDHINVLAE